MPPPITATWFISTRPLAEYAPVDFSQIVERFAALGGGRGQQVITRKYFPYWEHNGSLVATYNSHLDSANRLPPYKGSLFRNVSDPTKNVSEWRFQRL